MLDIRLSYPVNESETLTIIIKKITNQVKDNIIEKNGDHHKQVGCRRTQGEAIGDEDGGEVIIGMNHNDNSR